MRKSSIVLAAVIAVGLFSWFAPPVGAQVTVVRLEVTGSPVRPGGTFQVGAGGCTGDSNTVMVGLLDADEESDLASAVAIPDVDGDWNTSITVPSSVRPGTYPLTARCTNYDGYDGYNGTGGDDGYNGTGGSDGYNGYLGDGPGLTYPTAYVTVLPPESAPPSDGALTVTPDVIARGGNAMVTASGWNPGEQVTVMMYSAPVTLATVTTDDDGAISTQIRVPAVTTLGAHTVYAMNATSALHPPLTLSAPITVVDGTTPPTQPPTTQPPVTQPPATQPPTGPGAPTQVQGTSAQAGSLPFTGGNPWPLVALGVLLVLGGGELYRRHRTAAPAG